MEKSPGSAFILFNLIFKKIEFLTCDIPVENPGVKYSRGGSAVAGGVLGVPKSPFLVAAGSKLGFLVGNAGLRSREHGVGWEGGSWELPIRVLGMGFPAGLSQGWMCRLQRDGEAADFWECR